MKNLALAAVLLLLRPLAGGAAEFDVDSGATLLRRLQLCVDCGSALLVTRIQPGVTVRCPDCGREQPRLRDQYLIAQIYQMCRLCQAPLDAAGHGPGDTVECRICRTRQTLDRDAFLPPGLEGGPGYPPDHPPGSKPKRLLLNPDPDNVLAEAAPEVSDALPRLTDSANSIPLNDLEPRRPSAAPAAYMPESQPPEPPPSLPSPEGASEAAAAVDVPAVKDAMPGGTDTPPPPAVDGGILAKVNGKPIRRESVEAVAGPAIARLRANAGGAGDAELAGREREMRAAILDLVIDRAIAAEEAEKAGYKPNPAEVRARAAELAPRLAGTNLDPEREAYLELAMEAMRRRIGEPAREVRPETVRGWYQAHKGELLRPARLAIATLTVFRDRNGRADPRDYRVIAQEISAELEKGERFDALRARHDEFPPPPDEVSPPLLPEAHYSEEVRAMTDALRAGAVFGPVFLPGMALFGKVVEKRPSEPLPFAEAEKDIRRRLAEEGSAELFARWLDGVRKRAAVEMYGR